MKLSLPIFFDVIAKHVGISKQDIVKFLLSDTPLAKVDLSEILYGRIKDINEFQQLKLQMSSEEWYFRFNDYCSTLTNLQQKKIILELKEYLLLDFINGECEWQKFLHVLHKRNRFLSNLFSYIIEKGEINTGFPKDYAKEYPTYYVNAPIFSFTNKDFLKIFFLYLLIVIKDFDFFCIHEIKKRFFRMILIFLNFLLVININPIPQKLDNSIPSYFGPQRQSFSLHNLPNYLTLNSLYYSESNYDEQHFVSIIEEPFDYKELSYDDFESLKKTLTFEDTLYNISDNNIYTVISTVHNNSSDTNAIAEEVTANAEIININDTEKWVTVALSSSNTTPEKVWDSVKLKSDRGHFDIEFVSGSAVYITRHQNFQIWNHLFSPKGELLGYDFLNGKIPSGSKHGGYLLFKVRIIPKDNFDLEFYVRNISQNEKEWKRTTDANINDILEYQIEVRNLTSETYENIITRVVLPRQFVYQTGSTKLYNETNPKGLVVSDFLIDNSGINIGSYTHKGNAVIRFRAQVDVMTGSYTTLSQVAGRWVVNNDTVTVNVE